MIKKDVLIVGELLVDLLSENYVNSLEGQEKFIAFQGGSPSNVCANLKWLGNSVSLIACVGNDFAGDFLVHSLEKIGLETNGVYRSNEPSTMIVVTKSLQTPRFIPYRFADKQIPAIDKEQIEEHNIIHSCAFALSQNPAQKNILDAMEYAQQCGKKVSVDWNFSPAIWLDNDGKKVFQQIVSYKPLLKLSMDDMERFLNNNKLSIDEAKQFLQQYEAEVLCLTCGKDGVWLKQENSTWAFFAAQSVSKVVDTTGAGDAFWSGFLHHYLAQKSIADCVIAGINLASKKIQQLGPLYL